MNQEKVVLVQPSLARLYPLEGARHKLEPLGLEMIAVHNPHNTPVEIYDMDVYPDWVDFEGFLERERPSTIGIMVNTPLVKEAREITQRARKVLGDVFVVAGGNHPTHEPQHTLDYVQPDLVWKSDGENFLQVLAETDLREQARQGNRIFNSARLGGLGNMKEDKFAMDSLKFPLRHKPRDYFFTSVQASRGCLWKCIYCGSADKDVVWRTAGNILAEIDGLQEQELLDKKIYFLDDCFLDNPKRVRELCKGISDRKFSPPPQFWIETRTNTITEKLLDILKTAGCYQITFGLESGNQRVLDSLGKQLDVTKVPETLALVRKHGINIRANFMIGHYGETEEEVWDTIHLAELLQKRDLATTIGFYNVLPLPGTPLYRRIQEEGGTKIEKGFEDFKWYGDTVSKISQVDPRRLDELRVEACRRVKEASNAHRKSVDY